MCVLTSFHYIFTQLFQISLNFLICCLNKWTRFFFFPFPISNPFPFTFPFSPQTQENKVKPSTPPPLVATLLQWIPICIFCTLHHSVRLSWKRRYIGKWVCNLSPANIWHLLGFVSPIRKTFCQNRRFKICIDSQISHDNLVKNLYTFSPFYLNRFR